MTDTPSLAPLTRRPVLPSDDAFLRRLHDSTRAGEMAQTGWDEAVQDTFLGMQFRARQAHYLAQYPQARWEILLAGGAPVGCLRVAHGLDAHHLVEIALLPEQCGRGHGSRVLQEVIAEASAAGMPVRLQVDISNPARRLYARLGFAPVRLAGLYLLMEHPAL